MAVNYAIPMLLSAVLLCLKVCLRSWIVGQISLYLDDDTEQLLRSRAKAEGLSQSAWASRVLRAAAARALPTDILALAGSWSELPALPRPDWNSADLPRV